MKRSCLLILSCLALMACSHEGAKSETPAAAASGTATEGEGTYNAPPGARLKLDKEVDKIVFASCEDQHKPEPLWTDIAAAKPDLFLATGDNIYADHPGYSPISKMYEMQMQFPEYVKFRKEVPMLATWDDGDFAANDGGADNPLKATAKQEFLKFFSVNDAPLVSLTQGGVYHSAILGPKGKRLQIIMMDLRWFRSPLEPNEHPKNSLDIYQPTQDTTKTMLGAEQWAWLESELQKPADLRILVSSVQFLADEHGFEKWANFPHEKQRLLDLLEKDKIRNVVIVSGDRHAGEISQLKLKDGFHLVDVTASGINKTNNLDGEPNRFRVGARTQLVNFGTALIDWKRKSVHLELVGQQGQVAAAIDQKFVPAKKSAP